MSKSKEQAEATDSRRGTRIVEVESRLISFMEELEVYAHDGEGKLFLVEKADFIADVLHLFDETKKKLAQKAYKAGFDDGLIGTPKVKETK